jgi:hypothetical protein
MKPADRARWKAHERETARILGGERQPSNGKRQVDIEHPLFFIEHKARKGMPDWMRQAFSQVADCPPGKLPLVVFVHAPALPGVHVERYAIMRLGDFAELAHDAAVGRSLDL